MWTIAWGLSQKEGVARDAETFGWDLDPERQVVGVSRRGLWRLRTAMLHVASRCWASEDEISSLVGHFTFRAVVLERFLGYFQCGLRLFLNAEVGRDDAYGYPSFGNFGYQRV